MKNNFTPLPERYKVVKPVDPAKTSVNGIDEWQPTSKEDAVQENSNVTSRVVTRFTEEFIVSIILIILLVFLLNPFDFWMPSMVEMITVAGIVLIFALFSLLVWREQPRDEREGYHQLLAGRFAFLAGACVLVIGTAIGVLHHTLNPWLPLALGTMVLAKTAGIVYGRIKH